MAALHIPEETLSSLADGELPPDQVSPVIDHAASCADCRKRLEDFRLAAAMFSAASLPDIDQEFALEPADAMRLIDRVRTVSAGIKPAKPRTTESRRAGLSARRMSHRRQKAAGYSGWFAAAAAVLVTAAVAAAIAFSVRKTPDNVAVDPRPAEKSSKQPVRPEDVEKKRPLVAGPVEPAPVEPGGVGVEEKVVEPVEPSPGPEPRVVEQPEEPVKPPPAQTPEQPRIARLAFVQGAVRYARGATGEWIEVKSDAYSEISFFEGDRLDVRSGGARIELEGSAIYARSDTSLRFLRHDQAALADLARGEIHVVDNARSVEVLTPDGLVRPTGTAFDVRAADGRTTVAVAQGAVTVKARDAAGGTEPAKPAAGGADLSKMTWMDGETTVSAGQRTRVQNGRKPEVPEKADLAETLRWVSQMEGAAAPGAWVKVVPESPRGATPATPQTLGRLKPRPGETVWLKGGEYGVEGLSATGRPDAPIIFRAMPGEKAVFKSGLSVKGAHLRVWGVTAAGPQSTVSVAGRDIRIINCIADGAAGFLCEEAAVDAEVYGCLVRGGPMSGVLIKNLPGGPWKWIVDNIVFDQGGGGLSVYGSARSDHDRVHLEGNIAFGNGLAASERRDSFAQILVGRDAPAATRNIRVIDNCTWLPPRGASDLIADGKGIMLGFDSRNNENVICTGNYAAGGDDAFRIAPWSGRVDVSKNTFAGSGRVVRLADAPEVGGVAVPAPKGVHAVARVNRYEPNKVHLAVYNWDREAVARVDLHDVLMIGGTYKVFSVYDAEQNKWDKAAAEGVYGGGTIDIPMNSGRRWEPEFGAFIVVREYAHKADLELPRKAREGWIDPATGNKQGG
jgi:ferric-dicitrate binding protein FerR (iron transport regulator)